MGGAFTELWHAAVKVAWGRFSLCTSKNADWVTHHFEFTNFRNSFQFNSSYVHVLVFVNLEYTNTLPCVRTSLLQL